MSTQTTQSDDAVIAGAGGVASAVASVGSTPAAQMYAAPLPTADHAPTASTLPVAGVPTGPG